MTIHDDQMQFDNGYCRYDSDCDQGMVCQQNACTTIEYIHPPQPTIEDGQHIELSLGRPYIDVIRESGEVVEEIIIEEEPLIYTMDECGNVYDEQNQLIWGTGQCEMETVLGEQSSVMMAQQPVIEDQNLGSIKAQQIVANHYDPLIEPRLSSPVRYALLSLTLLQIIISVVLFKRYRSHVH